MSNDFPITIIRQSWADEASSRYTSKGEPTLLVSVTSNYEWIYNDKGSGSHSDFAIWRPKPTGPGWYILGDLGQGNYGEPTGSSLIVKAINDDPSNPIISQPLTGQYQEVWNDHGTGGDHDGSIWFPKAPDGYYALGFVGQAGYSQPNILSYGCIRRDFVTDSESGNLIWADHGSGGHLDVSVYVLRGVSGCFVAQQNYDPYVGPAHKLAQK